MSDEDHEWLEDLDVYASGAYPVELSNGKQLSQGHRVPLKASVDPMTGKVAFHIDPAEVAKLR